MSSARWYFDYLIFCHDDARLRHANGRRRADRLFHALTLEAGSDAMSYDNNYFRRELQALVKPIGRFNGQVQMAINGGRLCKLEFLHRAKFQCIHQGQDKWSQESGTVILTLTGAEKKPANPSRSPCVNARATTPSWSPISATVSSTISSTSVKHVRWGWLLTPTGVIRSVVY